MRRERTENVLPPLTKHCGGTRISIRARTGGGTAGAAVDVEVDLAEGHPQEVVSSAAGLRLPADTMRRGRDGGPGWAGQGLYRCTDGALRGLSWARKPATTGASRPG